jgi:hypothetical protein
VKGKRTLALKVSRIVEDKNGSVKEEFVFQQIDDDFPRNIRGEVDWK